MMLGGVGSSLEFEAAQGLREHQASVDGVCVALPQE
jgi:hypothetical protein